MSSSNIRFIVRNFCKDMSRTLWLGDHNKDFILHSVEPNLQTQGATNLPRAFGSLLHRLCLVFACTQKSLYGINRASFPTSVYRRAVEDGDHVLHDCPYPSKQRQIVVQHFHTLHSWPLYAQKSLEPWTANVPQWGSCTAALGVLRGTGSVRNY